MQDQAHAPRAATLQRRRERSQSGWKTPAASCDPYRFRPKFVISNAQSSVSPSAELRAVQGHVWTYMDPARLQQIGWIRLLVTTADVYPAS